MHGIILKLKEKTTLLTNKGNSFPNKYQYI